MKTNSRYTNSRYTRYNRSHHTKLRLMQNYGDANMFIFIALNHLYITFIIPIHGFHFAPICISGFRDKDTGIVLVTAKKVKKYWFRLAAYPRHGQPVCTRNCTILNLLANCAHNLSCHHCVTVLPSTVCVCVFLHILLVCIHQSRLKSRAWTFCHLAFIYIQEQKSCI
jgi:hypothetical protein